MPSPCSYCVPSATSWRASSVRALANPSSAAAEKAATEQIRARSARRNTALQAPEPGADLFDFSGLELALDVDEDATWFELFRELRHTQFAVFLVGDTGDERG